MKLMSVLALAVLSAACVAGDETTFKSLESAEKTLDSAMALVVKDDIDGAFEVVRPYWPLPGNELDTIILKTVQQRNVAGPRFGKPVGFVLVRKEKVGDFLIRYTYVEKREIHALRWMFVLYKARDTWAINSMFWDDNLPGLFEE